MTPSVKPSGGTARSLLLCYGKTPYTPGRYLEDALLRKGIPVVQKEGLVDFAALDLRAYFAVVFIESPSRPRVQVKNIHLVSLPKLFWIHHGENRLSANLEMCGWYRPDLLLMSHSLHLSHQFPAPVRFFPFGVDAGIFRSNTPWTKRAIDVAFVGGVNPLYGERSASLRRMQEAWQHQRKLSFAEKVYLHELGALYGNAKIVFNQTADHIKSFNMRVFEGMGCGALLLSDYSPEQEMLFQDGIHYVKFVSREDLFAKVDYYLTHPAEANKIAKTGQRFVRKNHTYEHRADQLLQWIHQIKP